MNIEENIFNKVNNSAAHQTDHTSWSSGIYAWDARMIQHTQIKWVIHCIKRMKDNIQMTISVNAQKSIWQNSVSYHSNTSQKIRYGRNVPQRKGSHVTNLELISPSNSTSSFIFERKEIILLKRYLHFHVHDSISHNSQDMKTT